MKVAIDGFAILHAVSKNSGLSHTAREATDKAALNIMKTLLSSKAIDLGRLKAIRGALGEQFALILDHLPDTTPKSLVKKIDPHNSEAKTGSAGWARLRLVALASGEAQPAEKPVRVSKKAGAKKSGKQPKRQDDTTETFFATSVMAEPKSKTKSRRGRGAD